MKSCHCLILGQRIILGAGIFNTVVILVIVKIHNISCVRFKFTMTHSASNLWMGGNRVPRISFF